MVVMWTTVLFSLGLGALISFVVLRSLFKSRRSTGIVYDIIYFYKWSEFWLGTRAISFMDWFRWLVLPPEFQLWEMSSAFTKSQCLYAAAKLDIADKLMSSIVEDNSAFEDTPKTISQLVDECNIENIDFFTRLIGHLKTFRIVKEQNGGKYSMTHVGHLLWDSHPKSSRALIMSQNSDHYLSMSELCNSITTTSRGSPFELYYPKYKSVWKFYDDHPQHSYWFNRYMHSINSQLVEFVIEDYQDAGLQNCRSMIDIGGGQGLLLSALIDQVLLEDDKRPLNMKAAIFDLPKVVEQKLIQDFWKGKSSNLSSPVELIGGNFFEKVPSGYDYYTLKFILHDWSDDECVTILSNIRKGMNQNSKLLIIENIMFPSNPTLLQQSHHTIDMIMVAMTNGRERTVDQYKQLLDKSNISLNRVIPTRSPVSILECKI